MKISIENLLKLNKIAIKEERVNVASEVMSVLSNEALEIGLDKGYHDVTIMINGIEHEPKIFALLISNQEDYIKEKAAELIREKYKNAIDKAEQLKEKIDEMCDKFFEEGFE